MNSKTRLGKKAISLLLSVLMVVTMLPTFAITAMADVTQYGNGVFSEYLTDSNKTGMSGTATWDNTMKAWSFNGSQYLKLDGTPLANVTTSSGFCISFEVYNTDNSLANKYFSFYNGSARISMDGSSPDWWTRYRTEISDGSSTRGYYTSDFTSSDFCSKTHSANGNDSYPTGAWYTMTVQMNTDGSYSYYRNGELLATFKSNYVSTGNGGGLSDANAAAAVSGATNYVVGASDTNGSNGFTGYIRNFKIVSNVSSGNAGSLASLMCIYEAKMDGTVYKNMAAAYNAYVDANEAFDAAVYGNSSTAQISAAYSAFNTAIGNMTAWTAATANNPNPADGSYNTSSLCGYNSVTDRVSNVLYQYGLSTSSAWTTATYCGDRIFFGLQYGSIVFMYNGSEMACPIDLYIGSGSSWSEKRCRYVTPTTSGFSLLTYWRGSEKKDESGYQGNYSSGCKIGYTDGDTSNTSNKNPYNNQYYTTTLVCGVSLNSSTYSSSYNVAYKGESNNGKTNTVTANGSGGNGDQTIYLVNYKVLSDAINDNSRKSYLNNVDSYKEGGLKKLVEAYDVATAINPNTYFSSVVVNNSSADNYVSKCVANAANAIKTAIEGSNGSGGFNNVGTITSDTANSNDYIALRNAIDLNAAPTGTAGSAVDGVKYSVRQLIADNGYVDTDNNGTKDTQLTGFSDFQTAYNNAKTVMAALGSSGYNTNSTSNYTDSTAGAKATALTNAFNALNLITLRTPTININNGDGGVYLGKSNGFTLTNNDGKTPQYSVRYSTDGGSTWGAWSSYSNYSSEVKVFKDLADTANKNNWAEIKTRSTDGNEHYSDESSATRVKFLSAPTLASSTGSDELSAAGTVTLTQTSDSSGTLQYSFDNFAHYADYSTAFSPFGNTDLIANDGVDNRAVSTITVYAREKKGTSYSPVTSATYNKSVLAPTFSVPNGAYLGKASTVTISNNSGNTESGAVTIDYHYDSDSYSSYSSALTPFSGKQDSDGSASRTIHAKATRNGKTAESSITVNYLSRPTWSSTYVSQPNNELAAGETITISQTSGLESGLQYSYTGNSNDWHDYSAPIAPFTDNTSVSTITVYMRQVSDYGESPVLSVVFNKTVQPPTFSVSDGVYLDKTHGVEILDNDANTESGTVTFTYKYDSGEEQAYSSELFPFSGKQDSDGGATVTINANAHRNGVTSVLSSINVHYLSRPNVKIGDTALANNTIVASSDAITVTNTSGATDGLKYSINGGSTWNNISNGGSFSPFSLNTTATKLTVQIKQEKDGSTSPIYSVTIYKKPAAPTILADNEFLDKTHGVAASLNNGTDDTAATLEISTDGNNFTAYSGKVYPFSGVTDENSRPTITYYYRAKRVIDGITAYSDVVNTGTLYYLAQPRIMDTSGNADLTVNQALVETYRITLAQQSGHNGDLKYSYDGTTWNDYDPSDKPAPFVDNPTKLAVTIYAKQVSGDCTSAVKQVKVVRDTAFYIYSATGDPVEYSNNMYNENSTLYISTSQLSAGVINAYNGTTKYEDDIYYMVTRDGAVDTTIYAYDESAGIDCSLDAATGIRPDFKGAHAVTITVWLCEGGTTTVKDYVTQTFLNTDNYDDEIMQESFDGASISGTTLTMRGKTANASDDRTATLSASGTASIVSGAGYVDSNGNSPDWRKNVLKINANSTAPGNYIRLNQNPLTEPGAAAAANAYGVTISFWRYLEKNGSCADLGASGDPTGYPWRNAIAFDDGNASNGAGYYLIEVNGVNSVCRTQGTDYCDYVQENQDPTGHAAGNNRGHWVNVVITLDPSNGITLYTNGEPHEMKAGYPNKAGTYSSKSDAQVAQDIISLITSNSTNMYFNYGDRWEGNDFDMYLDDLRIYSGVKTQVEINNMYIDSDADVQSDLTSTSHDPTNVTVYTLAHDVTYVKVNDAGNDEASITLAAGTTVGQEVIDYCSLNPNPNINNPDVTAVDEYSFGTGMTIYKRNQTTKKWEVVGDDQGRCGYQNQKLFGNEYHTAISEALDYAAGDSRTGAGHLVWAPHVMFNLYKGRWVYYGSTSSWGSQRSAIFVCDARVGGSIEGPYSYRQIVYKSTGHPNAIDPCVYYEYDANGKPVMNHIYMAFGSWGGENCIALKTLYADGDGNDTAEWFDGNNTKYLCNGINSTLEDASDGSSGEGAYIIHDGSYYYLYVSYGQNTGSYVERVYRSDNPTEGFKGYNNITALDTSTTGTHGGQILAPFDLSNHDYLMVSTGHNSVYKTVNSSGDTITVNSAHARPYANANHDWKALPDGALATRQSEVTGNVNMLNAVTYNYGGWPVLMPFQYDGTDRVEFGADEITAETIQGIYGANDLRNIVDYSHCDEYIYSIVKDPDDEMLAYEYGTDGEGRIFRDYIVIEKQLLSSGKYRYYARYYDAEDFDLENKRPITGRTPLYDGVIGKHGNQVGISMVCTSDFEYTWTYKIRELPNVEDVDPLGDSVSMDGVIYTHLTNDSYAKYGREISDDFQYGTSDLHQGERCTTITTTYPAKINTKSPAAIYCLSDEEHCQSGSYVGGDYDVVALMNDKWFDSAGIQYTDAEAIANDGHAANDPTDTLKRRYGLTGYVSDYHFDSSTGTYKDEGLKLIISYEDVENSSKNYSEFEFCYIMANPAMAHTIQGIRNQHKDGSGYKDIRAGHILFDRFIGSSGQASNIGSSYVWNKRVSASAEAHSTGTYKYLDSFGSSASISHDYSSPSATATAFDDFESNEGVNSGSYGVIEHDNDGLESYTVSSKVIDTDYYIDYSNEDNYDINNNYGTITTSNGVPTGYKFRFRTSNINWSKTNDKRWNATSYMLLTGDLKANVTTNSTYNSSIDTFVDQNSSGNEGRYTYGNYTSSEMTALGYTNNCFKISGLGSYSTNDQSRSVKHYGDTENKYTLGLNRDGDEGGRIVMCGYYYNPSAYIASVQGATSDNIRTQSDYYCHGLTRALPLIDTGNSNTNAWNMHIDFTGTKSVNKNTDTSSAEKYANFIIEQGVGIFSYGINERHATEEETYAYYNIGVHTCDKGAARHFAKNYLRKKLAVTENEDGSVTVIKDANGAPKYLDESGNVTTDVNQAAIINPQDFTLSSYNDYLDAVAELNYFVKNPNNTTFKDYPKAGRNTSTEYVTAYTAGGAPIYNTTTAGNNILNTSSSAHTDEVQAELIQNVIKAYQDLFQKEDYTDAEKVYAGIELLDSSAQEASTVENVVTINITPPVNPGQTPVTQTYSKAQFTDDSWEDFVELIIGVSSAFDYDADADPKDKDSWRHVELSGEEYRNLLKILKQADDTLLEKVDISTLTATYNTKHSDAAGGIFADEETTVDGKTFAAGEQMYTFVSWDSLNSECITANEMLDSSDSHYAQGQSITVRGEDIANHGESEPNFTYTQGKYEVTGITKYTFSNVDFYSRNIGSGLSTAQTAVNTENTTLSGKSLVVVDNPSCYDTFDGAYAVVDTLDLDKYTEEGQSIVTTAANTADNNVYVTLTAAQASAYNTAVPGANLTDGYKARKASSGTDDSTEELLTAVNTVNTTKVGGSGEDKDDYKYIKYFMVTFNTQYAETDLSLGSEEHKVMYGDPITVSIDENDKIVHWGVSIYDGVYADYDKVNGNFTDSNGDVADPIATQKVSSSYGGSLTRIANRNMSIVAEVEKQSVEEGTIQYDILDCYGKLVDVMYGTSLTRNGVAITDSTEIENTDYDLMIGSKAVPKNTIPFYTLTGWNITKNSDSRFTIKPKYSVLDTYSITVIDDGEPAVSPSVQYDSKFTLSISDTNKDKFVAWAVKTSANKYQIVSYSKTYKFFVVANETYIPIINNGTEESPDYETVEGVDITAENIDGVITATGTIDKTEFITTKIKQKYPFVSIQNATMSDPNTENGKYTKARAYVRITEGSDEKLASYGILYFGGNKEESGMVIGGSSVQRRAVTNKLSTGQFTYTLTNKNGFKVTTVTFRGYVNYNFEYNAVDTTATINGLDYSNVGYANA